MLVINHTYITILTNCHNHIIIIIIRLSNIMPPVLAWSDIYESMDLLDIYQCSKQDSNPITQRSKDPITYMV